MLCLEQTRPRLSITLEGFRTAVTPAVASHPKALEAKINPGPISPMLRPKIVNPAVGSHLFYLEASIPLLLASALFLKQQFKLHRWLQPKSLAASIAP